MKKVLFILVAIIGFGISANAQCVNANITYESKDNGNTMLIKVNVQVSQSGQQQVCVNPIGKFAAFFSTTDRCKVTNSQGNVMFTFSCNTEKLSGETCRSNDFTYTVNGKTVRLCED